MSIIPSWPFAAGALVLGIVIGGGVTASFKNAKIDRIHAQHTAAELLRKSQQVTDLGRERGTEQEMVESLTRNLQKVTDEKSRIAVERDNLAVSLQNRPARIVTVPGATRTVTAACNGGTGAGLSREDAEFLGGEAARANTIRAELGQCQADYEELRLLANRPATQAAPTPQ